MRAAATVLLLLGLASGLSCGDGTGPPAPVPGALLLELTTPYPDDAALLLQLSGPALAPAALSAAMATYHLYVREAAGGGVNVAVFGSLSAGPLLRLQVPDASRVSEYGVTIVEVADATNALRDDVSGYAARFVRD